MYYVSLKFYEHSQVLTYIIIILVFIFVNILHLQCYFMYYTYTNIWSKIIHENMEFLKILW